MYLQMAFITHELVNWHDGFKKQLFINNCPV